MQVISPSVPFWGHISGGLNPGTVIQIDGHIPHHCSKFEISLYCGNEMGHHAEKHSNIALQIRPKIHTKKLICNSRHHGSWGSKEKHKNFHHVYHGSNFTLQIIVEHQHYRIVTNGHEACYFHHRIPFHEVRVLNVEGHVTINRIEYQNQYSAMPSAPAYPIAPPNYTVPVVQQGYRPPVNSYPAPPVVYPQQQPVYMTPPVIQPSYVPSTVIIEERHHGHHHHHGGGIIGAIEHAFSHDHHHHGSHHHHGHHGSHHHGGHHW